jgi:hypothetical protein
LTVFKFPELSTTHVENNATARFFLPPVMNSTKLALPVAEEITSLTREVLNEKLKNKKEKRSPSPRVTYVKEGVNTTFNHRIF